MIDGQVRVKWLVTSYLAQLVVQSASTNKKILRQMNDLQVVT